MMTMQEIDRLRTICDARMDVLRVARNRIIPTSVEVEEREYRAALRAVEKALQQWWAQGCEEREPPQPKLPPARCNCGAYPWPKNMADGGAIGDSASIHKADKCYARAQAGGGCVPDAAVAAFLAEILFILQSNARTSDPVFLGWRERVRDAMIRSGAVKPATRLDP